MHAVLVLCHQDPLVGKAREVPYNAAQQLRPTRPQQQWWQLVDGAQQRPPGNNRSHQSPPRKHQQCRAVPKGTLSIVMHLEKGPTPPHAAKRFGWQLVRRRVTPRPPPPPPPVLEHD